MSDYEPDWYDTHCPTCDAPEPTHRPTCAVSGHESADTGSMPERKEPSMSNAFDRDRLRSVVGAVLFNVSNFPEKAQARLLGQDMGPLIDKTVDAILVKFLPTYTERTRAGVLAEVREHIEAIPTQYPSRFARDFKADALAVLDRAAGETGEEPMSDLKRK